MQLCRKLSESANTVKNPREVLQNNPIGMAGVSSRVAHFNNRNKAALATA